MVRCLSSIASDSLSQPSPDSPSKLLTNTYLLSLQSTETFSEQSSPDSCEPLSWHKEPRLKKYFIHLPATKIEVHIIYIQAPEMEECRVQWDQTPTNNPLSCNTAAVEGGGQSLWHIHICGNLKTALPTKVRTCTYVVYMQQAQGHLCCLPMAG